MPHCFSVRLASLKTMACQQHRAIRLANVDNHSKPHCAGALDGECGYRSLEDALGLQHEGLHSVSERNCTQSLLRAATHQARRSNSS
jgi:hypothetical protein